MIEMAHTMSYLSCIFVTLFVLVIMPQAVFAGCPSDWLNYGGTCYKPFLKEGEKKTWWEARKFCKKLRNGGSLASLTSYHMDQKLRDLVFGTGLIETYAKHNTPLWIGLHDRNKEGDWEWVDGKPFKFTKWGIGEPNNYGKGEDCVQWLIYEYKTSWNDNKCTRKMGYLCQGPQDPLICPPDWIPYGDMCYAPFWEREKYRWDASKYCKEIRKGGRLASITSEALKNHLKKEIMENFFDPGRNSMTLWIGLNDMDHEGVYKWSDGQPYIYTDWEKGEPNDSGNEDCVNWEVKSTNSQWNDNKCRYTRGFLCQAPKDLIGATPDYGSEVTLSCPSKWIKFGKMCYKPFWTNPKSWFEARRSCKQLQRGGTLASLTSRALMKTLRDRILPTFSSSWERVVLWIGLNDRDREGDYIWDDDQPFKFKDWENGEPNNSVGVEDCIDWEINRYFSIKSWNDLNCWKKRGYLCQAPVARTYKKQVLA